VAAVKAFVVEVWRRLFNLTKALDAFLFSALTLGGSRDGEYASSAAWNQRVEGHWHGFVSSTCIDLFFFLLFLDRDHCEQSWHGQRHLYPQTKETS